MFYFSDDRVASTKTSKLPTCLTNSKYLIMVNAFRGHDLAGFTLTGKNFFGSIFRPDVDCKYYDNEPAQWCPTSLHKFVNMTGMAIPGEEWLPQQKMGEYNVLVDLLGHDHTTNGKGLIFFSDGTYGGLNELGTSPIKFQQSPFDNHWTSSIFASQDFVALDSVGLDFLRNEPTIPYPLEGCSDNYLHEAALANDPPSGTKYIPSGHQLESLGVHEHWNNVKDKQYTRNLGTGDGIELIPVHRLNK